jgi:hypothetical protein
MIPAIIAGAVAAGSIASSLYNGSKDREARSDMVNRLGEMKAQSDNQYDQILRDIAGYYDRRGSLGTAQDASAYKQAIADYNPDSFVYTPTEFSYNKTRDDFINPYMQTIIGDEVANVQHSAAGAGLGRGSGAAQAIAQAVAEKENELFKEAQQEYKDDRNFEYQKYNDYARQMQEALNQKRAATDTKLTMQGNLAQDYYNVMDSAQADKLKAQQDKIATGATYSTAMAGLY